MTKKLTEFVQIPHVGTVPAYKVDPLNRAEVAALIRRADAYFRLSKTAWEDANNNGSGRPAYVKMMEAREKRMAEHGESLLAPFGIECDWPGLWPSFKVNGFQEYTTEAAVFAAIGGFICLILASQF